MGGGAVLEWGGSVGGGRVYAPALDVPPCCPASCCKVSCAPSTNAVPTAALQEHRAGSFCCAGCSSPLFAAETKFESGTGWPSFFDALPGAVALVPDNKIMFMPRVEVGVGGAATAGAAAAACRGAAGLCVCSACSPPGARQPACPSARQHHPTSHAFPCAPHPQPHPTDTRCLPACLPACLPGCAGALPALPEPHRACLRRRPAAHRQVPCCTCTLHVCCHASSGQSSNGTAVHGSCLTDTQLPPLLSLVAAGKRYCMNGLALTFQPADA